MCPMRATLCGFNFDPQAGHEQAGRRPAVVLSPAAYNAKTSLMLCCPMTTQIKNYPFEVLIAGPAHSAPSRTKLGASTGGGDEPSEKEQYLPRNWRRSAPKSVRSSDSPSFFPFARQAIARVARLAKSVFGFRGDARGRSAVAHPLAFDFPQGWAISLDSGAA